MRQNDAAVKFVSIPYCPVKARRASMQQVVPVVAIEGVVHAVECEARVRNPVGPPADDAAEERAARQVFGRSVVPQEHICDAAGPVGGVPGDQRRAEIADRHPHAMGIAHSEQTHGVAAGEHAPAFDGNTCRDRQGGALHGGEIHGEVVRQARRGLRGLQALLIFARRAIEFAAETPRTCIAAT